MLLLLTHAAATWAMAGLIWFVQVVHYPLFAAVGDGVRDGAGAGDGDGFRAYSAAHTRRTGWVVGPPMLTELACAIWLVCDPPAGVPGWAAWCGLGLLAAVWASTAVLQVPAHRTLGGGFDAATVRRLVGTNWVRTAGWTARGLLAAWMIAVHAG